MKSVMILVGLALLFGLTGSAALADMSASEVQLFVSCIDRSQPDRVTVWFGYEASEGILGTGYIGALNAIGIVSMPPSGLAAGRHARVFAVDVYYGQSTTWQFAAESGGEYTLTVSAETNASDCSAADTPSGSITFEAAPGCYTWQYLDSVWHDVRLNDGNLAVTCTQEEEGKVFVRLTVAGQDVDPARWRMWKVEGA